MYEVIDLLDSTVAFEGTAKKCIDYVKNHGPSYDIIPKIVEVRPEGAILISLV